MKESSLLRRAKDLYGKSTHDHYYLVAFLLRGGNIISEGVNRYTADTHPMTTHAEIDALNRLFPTVDASGLRLVIFRITRGGNLANARPCPACTGTLLERGVTRVKHSTPLGVTEWVNLISLHGRSAP